MNITEILNDPHGLTRLLELLEKKRAMHLANADVQRISNQAAAVKTAERYAVECAGFAATVKATISLLTTKQAAARKAKASESEVVEFFKGEGLPKTDAEWFFCKCEGCGWTNNGQPIRDWKMTVRAWRAAKILPSQKGVKGYSGSSNASATAVAADQARTYALKPEEEPMVVDLKTGESYRLGSR